MDFLLEYFPQTGEGLGLAVLGFAVALLLFWLITNFLWCRFVPLRPIQLSRQDWMRFEQRRWTNPGDALRAFLGLGIAVICIGGPVAVPWWLGVAKDPGWYLKEWWIGVFFGGFAVSIVSAMLIASRATHRCAKCRSSHMAKDMADEVIYVCRACEIVWRTGIYPRTHDDHHHHHF
jgi:ribosomal protein L37AE/L43A